MYKLWNFLQPPTISSVSETNILLKNLFPNILNQSSCYDFINLYSCMYHRLLIICTIFQSFHSAISRKRMQQDL
jgi:hypothetical protein